MMATGWVRTSSWADRNTDSPPSKRLKEGERTPTFEDIFNGGSSQSNGQQSTASRGRKVFNDSIHGPITLDPLLVSIIDTPQFQRLRDVKQLGASYWVYPGGSHNRFEHCIGTSHLCGLMLKTLRDLHEQEYDDPVEITDKDILCVKIAGLCHDLGHGPFSHVFDMKYLRYIDPKIEWEHEEGSCSMFDFMLEDNPDLMQSFENRGIGSEEREIIKNMILGLKPGKDNVFQTCNFRGESMPKWFLYEIVSNKRNGIDCDKFDYFMRDCHYVGVKSNFDCHRYFQNIRIMAIDKQLQICVRDKEIFNLYELYHTRWSLHHRVYQHKTTKIIEHMLVEAIALVDSELCISESIRDPAKYQLLTDSIIYDILRSPKNTDSFKASKAMLRKIQKRDLYRFCGQINPLSTHKTDNTPSQEILDASTVVEAIVGNNVDLTKDDVYVDIVRINFGMKNKNPVDHVVFFGKEGLPFYIRQHQISELLPKTYQEQFIRVYAKNSSKKRIIEDAFTDWCRECSYEIPNILLGDKTGYFTNVHKNKAIENVLMVERQNNVGSARRSLSDLMQD